jgi:hypothetical protein
MKNAKIINKIRNEGVSKMKKELKLITNILKIKICKRFGKMSCCVI